MIKDKELYVKFSQIISFFISYQLLFLLLLKKSSQFFLIVFIYYLYINQSLYITIKKNSLQIPLKIVQ
jgi:hypothetical protein